MFFMAQTKMGSFVIKTTGTWVRWNLQLGIISDPPNSCTQATERGTVENGGTFPQVVCCSPCVRANVVIIKIIDKIVMP